MVGVGVGVGVVLLVSIIPGEKVKFYDLSTKRPIILGEK